MGVQVTVWPRGTKRVRSSGPLGVDMPGETRRAGHPLFVQDYGSLVSVQASTRYEPGFGGHDLASWTVTPHGGYVGGLMRPGDHVQITKGGGIVFEGQFSEAEPNADGTVTLHARGYAYSLFDIAAVFWQAIVGGDDIYYFTTELGLPGNTTNPLYAWAYAVVERGLPITQIVGDTSAWNGPFGESDMAEAPLTLGDLVTSVHQELGERWAVWGRTLVLGPDATTPMWSYAAPEGLVGVADSDYATRVNVFFVDTTLCYVQPWLAATAYGAGDTVSSDGRWWKALVPVTGGGAPVEGSAWTEVPTAYRKSDFSMAYEDDSDDRISRFGPRDASVDYRGLGAISSSRAHALALSLLEQVKGRFILSGSISVGPDSGFASANGGKADIAFVRAGQVLKLPGLRTDQGNLMDSDTTVIGKTDWSWSADGQESMQITPMGAVPRSLGDILKGAPLDSTSVVSGSRRLAS